MPARQSKRAQRESQDAQALQQLHQEAGDAVEDESASNDEAAPAGSAFAALAIEEEDVDSEPDLTVSAPSSAKKKKKRRKPKAKETEEASAPVPTKPPSKKPEKVAPLDDIDAALRDLNAKCAASLLSVEHRIKVHRYASTSTASDEAARFRTNSSSAALKACLAVDVRNLDADAELKRMFGARVVNAAVNQPAKRGAGAHNPHHKAGRARSALAKPTAYWPPIHLVKSGLTMEPVEERSAIGGDIWHSFEHSRSYKEAQGQFLQAVSSHDPNAIYALLAVQPYHIDSLLQLSEIQAHQGDHGQAEDFLDRALYAMERAFAPTFQLTSGSSRLSFARVESRAMFRACERKVSSLMRRGCWRTAFEFAKLLLSLSPFDDPFGALLFLDFLAPKTKQPRFLEKLMSALVEAADGAAIEEPLKIETYPGLAFGHALALFESETAKDHKESSDALLKAILRFPAVVLLLYDKLDLSYPKSISSLPRAQAPPAGSRNVPLTWILSQLYVHRSESLWKAPEVKVWLQEGVRAAEPKLSDQSDPDVALGWNLMQADQPYGPNVIPHGIARHILATDIAAIKALLPPTVFNAQSFSYDLLPPRQDPRATFYDKTYFSGLSGRQDRAMRNALGGLTMQRIMQMLQANGGPDGANLDELQALVAQMTEMQNGGTMPGTLDEAEEGDLPPGPIAANDGEDVQGEAWPLRHAPAALFGLWQRLAGAATAEAESDDE